MMDQHACPMVSISGPDGVGMVMLGSPTVLFNGMMACRMGDVVMEIPWLALGLANPILMGEPTVMIGEIGMGSPTVIPPVPPLVLLAQAMSGSGTTGPSSAGGSLALASQSGIPFIKPCQGEKPYRTRQVLPLRATGSKSNCSIKLANLCPTSLIKSNFPTFHNGGHSGFPRPSPRRRHRPWQLQNLFSEY
jgi:hypothetical protein